MDFLSDPGHLSVVIISHYTLTWLKNYPQITNSVIDEENGHEVRLPWWGQDIRWGHQNACHTSPLRNKSRNDDEEVRGGGEEGVEHRQDGDNDEKEQRWSSSPTTIHRPSRSHSSPPPRWSKTSHRMTSSPWRHPVNHPIHISPAALCSSQAPRRALGFLPEHQCARPS